MRVRNNFKRADDSRMIKGIVAIFLLGNEKLIIYSRVKVLYLLQSTSYPPCNVRRKPALKQVIAEISMIACTRNPTDFAHLKLYFGFAWRIHLAGTSIAILLILDENLLPLCLTVSLLKQHGEKRTKFPVLGAEIAQHMHPKLDLY